MAFPDTYTIKQRLTTGAAVTTVSLIAGAVMFVVALMGYYSKENALYLANEQAAEEFVRVVEVDWPSNRANVFFAINHARSTYINTGENDPAKFKRLERLQDWFLRSQTAGEEMLFLTEVRARGQVVASQLWFGELSRIFLSTLLTMVVVALTHFKLIDWLRKTDPRLRPLGA